MRIIAGKYRGRALQSPSGKGTRPTASRTREALFNLLQHHSGLREAGFGGLVGAHVADLCCGTGALGFEALSRGAETITFIDNHGAALAALKQNITTLKATAQCHILRATLPQLPPAPTAHDLILFDPPYGKGLIPPTLAALQNGGWLHAGSIIILETAKDETLTPPDMFTTLDSRRYGATKLWLVSCNK